MLLGTRKDRDGAALEAEESRAFSPAEPNAALLVAVPIHLDCIGFGSIWAAAAQWTALSATRSATLSSMVSRNLIDQAGRLLAETAGAKSTVVLFGSHARGEARVDSDVDFLVIEPIVKDRHKEWQRLRRALRDFPAPVDIVVVDEKRAERRAKVPGTMVHHALRDGQVLAHA